LRGKPRVLRLTWIDNAQRGRLLLVEGEIVDEWSDILERECSESRRRGDPPHELDLSGTTHVDRRGLETLRRLADRGFRIVGENPLIAEVRRAGGW
jgi:hypothetical protein